MRYFSNRLVILSLIALFVVVSVVGALGRGARGGGGGGGMRGGGGAAARPAPARPAPSRPAPSRPSAPSMARPSAPARPQVKSPAQTPSISRPSAPASRPNLPAAKANLPKVGGGGAGRDFNLPGNAQLPKQLPSNRPAVNRPGDIGKGKMPDIGKGKLPDIGKGNFPNIGDKGFNPKGKTNLPDLKKNNPGLFDPKIGGGKLDGKIAGKGPSRDDVSNWIGMPKNRPNVPGGGGAAGRPIDRPNQKKIDADFKNNWKTAIGGDKVNIGGKKIGDINVDLSKNINYNNMSRHANVVNNNLRPVQGNWFNQGWWNNHNHAHWPNWHYHNYGRPFGYWWRPASWGALTGFMVGAAWSPPVYYDYGSNVVYHEDVVYVNEQPVASAPVYAQQAIDLAAVEPPPEEAKIEWMPLGTFALASKKDDDNPNVVLQLAVAKDGLVSGVWYNRSTEASSDVEGRVDPETQRVALRKPDEPDVVLEVGIYNLTKEASSCLMHFGTLQTQTWYLTRLENQE